MPPLSPFALAIQSHRQGHPPAQFGSGKTKRCLLQPLLNGAHHVSILLAGDSVTRSLALLEARQSLCRAAAWPLWDKQCKTEFVRRVSVPFKRLSPIGKANGHGSDRVRHCLSQSGKAVAHPVYFDTSSNATPPGMTTLARSDDSLKCRRRIRFYRPHVLGAPVGRPQPPCRDR